MSTRDAGVDSVQCRFLLLGKARCGSTFVRSLLSSHPRVLALGEIFRDMDRIGWDHPGYDRDFQSPELIEAMRADPVAFLEQHVFAPRADGITAVGFKIFYYHAQDEARRRLWDHLASRPGLRVIHLKRLNTLRELLSLKRAELTGEWYRTDPDAPGAPAIELDVEECRRQFAYARDMKERFDRLFGERATLEVTYEELLREQAATCERVLRFLGVDVRPLSASIVKQTREPLAVAISNYAELLCAFRGTPWEAFFDEP